MSTRKCPKGLRYRKTYTRRGTRVKGRCIKSQTRATESSRNKAKRILGGVRKSIRSYKGTCKKGMILRKAFVRYSKKGKRTLVKESCIRNIGAPGKGLRGSPGIGPLRKGDLSKFGYSRVNTLSVSERHGALQKAVSSYGSLTTWRKLNAVYVYTRRTSPGASRIFKDDMDWIRSRYGIEL